MMKMVKPDFQIHVGIKDGECVSCNWGEMYNFVDLKDNTEIKNQVVQYLKKAIKHVQYIPKK